MPEGTADSTVTETPVNPGIAAPQVEVVDLTPKVEEPPASENTVEEKKEAKEQLSPKLSKLRQREAKIAEREAAADQKLKDADARLAEAQKPGTLERLKKQPSKVLAELGISFNDLAKAVLDETDEDDSPSELETVKASLQEIQDKLDLGEEEKKQEKTDAENAQLQAAINGIQDKISEYIDTNADKYDLIIATENKDLVYSVMEESFLDTGTVMQYTEACEVVEKYLTEKAAGLSKSKKIRQMVSPEVPKPNKTSFGRTLSSQVTQVAAATDKKPDMSKLSHDERVKVLAKQLRYY